jgi:hypothetical protein
MASTTTEALALAERLEAFLPGDLQSLDPGARLRLSEAARKLHLATEATGDTVHRIIHSVGA